MKINKTHILYSALGLTIAFGIYTKFQEQRFRLKYKKLEEQKLIVSKDLVLENGLHSIDSLLTAGDFENAFIAYEKQSVTAAEDEEDLFKFRINITRKFLDMEAQIKKQKESSMANKKALGDKAYAASADEIRKYDSLSFELEKAKVKLSRMYKRFEKKSFGVYLTFKNSKGHQVYYLGEVRKKKANGYGMALFDTGSRYEGEWENNRREGMGTFFWSDGQSYKGEYKNDLRNGQGTYYWPNGEKYIGQWKNDHREGKGEFFNKSGQLVTRGIWKNDELIKEL